MSDDPNKDLYSRRGFLGMGSAALAAAGLVSAHRCRGPRNSGPIQPRPTAARVLPGPTNPPLDAQNPDSNLPPATDAGGVQTFKYPFALSHKRMQEGGWSREVTVRELAVSKSIAGVDMRLTAGGVRELHWHTAAEWAFMLYGNARITAIDLDGKSFVADVTEGDLWYFPTGIPHSIQGLNPDGAEFLLVFDDGNFSEYETVLLTDWMAHTPRDVLAKQLRRKRAGHGTHAEEGEIYFPGCSSRPADGGPEGGRRVSWRIAAGFRFSRGAAGGFEAHQGRRSADHRFQLSLRCRPRLRRRWSLFTPAEYANCTGIPMPTSGSTTSPAQEE